MGKTTKKDEHSTIPKNNYFFFRQQNERIKLSEKTITNNGGWGVSGNKKYQFFEKFYVRNKWMTPYMVMVIRAF